ncbi:hypothetical protein VP393E501_P0041 [Vibrio phage 393E50-1]|nr:hypothetical protein VP393E501_P0041 [Vibrio phage 393E50-1]
MAIKKLNWSVAPDTRLSMLRSTKLVHHWNYGGELERLMGFPLKVDNNLQEGAVKFGNLQILISGLDDDKVYHELMGLRHRVHENSQRATGRTFRDLLYTMMSFSKSRPGEVTYLICHDMNEVRYVMYPLVKMLEGYLGGNVKVDRDTRSIDLHGRILKVKSTAEFKDSHGEKVNEVIHTHRF